MKTRIVASLVSCLLLCGSALAVTPVAMQTSVDIEAKSKTAVDAVAVEQSEHACLRQTGSRIHHRAGTCAFGRSYSGDDLRRTGANDVAHGLQLLDPAISAHF